MERLAGSVPTSTAMVTSEKADLFGTTRNRDVSEHLAARRQLATLHRAAGGPTPVPSSCGAGTRRGPAFRRRPKIASRRKPTGSSDPAVRLSLQRSTVTNH
jgi:hypothetical protein